MSMLNPYGAFAPADPATAYSGMHRYGTPSAYMNILPQQALPNASATYFETSAGTVGMSSSVGGAEALPATATSTAPGQVPIAIDAGGSGIIQDVQGGGGEMATIAAFLPPGVRMQLGRGRSWLGQRTTLPVVGPVPNWALAGAAALALLKLAR